MAENGFDPEYFGLSLYKPLSNENCSLLNHYPQFIISCYLMQFVQGQTRMSE